VADQPAERVDRVGLRTGARREPGGRGSARGGAAREPCAEDAAPATTAKERDDLGAEVGAGLASIGQALATLQRYADPADADDSARLHAFSAAVGTWSGHLRDFVTLVQAQPLDLSQMNWQVGTQDVSLLVETGKLEKLVAMLVKTRGAKSKATLDASATIFSSSFAMIAAMTGGLIVLAIVIAERVVRRLAAQLGGEPAHAKAIAADIARAT
jgi:methyl-accepting chemotaxis protein